MDAQAQLQQLKELFEQGFIPESEYLKRKEALPNTERDEAEKIFKYFDTDNDGYISVNEFQNLVFELGEILADSQVKEIVTLLDQDSDGSINFNEFYSWWNSPDHKNDTYIGERINLLKAKLTSKSYMRTVRGAANKLRGSRAGGKLREKAKNKPSFLENDENLQAAIQIELGKLENLLSSISLRHHRDLAKAEQLRQMLNKEENTAMATVAFKCKPEANKDKLNAAAKYMTQIVKGNFAAEDIPIEDFNFHLSEENGDLFLRATAALPVEFSMMGAGFLGGIGIQQLLFDLEFGTSGSTRVALKTSVSRGAISMIEELVTKKTITQFATYFLNNFNGMDVKFKFASLEEASNHLMASKMLGASNEFVKEFILLGQKLTSPVESDEIYSELVNKLLFGVAQSPDLLQFFQAAWFAARCAKENLQELSSISIAIGDEVFDININIPKLFNVLPSFDQVKEHGLIDSVDAIHVLTDEEASKLPALKQFRRHEAHELMLKKGLFDWVDHYWCDDCECFGKGWVYYCPECMFVVHPFHLDEDI